MKRIVIYPAPKNFKITNPQDIAVKVSAEPILDRWPHTNYIITQRTNQIHYMGKGNKVKEVLPI